MEQITKGIFPFILMIFLIGCDLNGGYEESSEETDQKLTIYTTVYPLQFLVEELGGDSVRALSVYPPGVDGHLYEPTSKEMTHIADGDAFIYIGSGMESFADSISNALANQDISLIEIGMYEKLFQKETFTDSSHIEDDQIVIEVTGLSHHYHTGDAVNLHAKLNTDSDYETWHWYTLAPGGEWQIVEGMHSNNYEGKAEIAEQQIKAVLLDENHEVVAESSPITITIDDHDEEHIDEHHDDPDPDGHVDQNDEDKSLKSDADAVEIEGLAPHYHTGDPIVLKALTQEPYKGHWHWYTSAPGLELVDESHGDTYEGQADIPNLQIKAVLYDTNDKIIAKSEAVTITIDDHIDHDPHIWVDPLRMIEIADIIKDHLIELNPDYEHVYNENFSELKAKLTDLDQRYMDLLSKKENKHIIVPHSAFGYWEERYGVKQITISGLSSVEEPSQKDLIEVMNTAKKFDIEYVLYEQNSGNRLSDIVQEEIGAKALMIHNLEVRTEEDIENEEDYISLMEYNLKILDEITK